MLKILKKINEVIIFLFDFFSRNFEIWAAAQKMEFLW